LGERSSALLPLEAQKLSAGAVLLSPFLPLLFMGEEYGETAPFLYFTSHTDANLANAVRQGRKEEFKAFAWKGELPDPQAESTFVKSKLAYSLRATQPHHALWNFYQELIHLRKSLRPLRNLDKKTCEVGICGEEGSLLFLRRWRKSEEVLAFFNFGDHPSVASSAVPRGKWRKLFDSADAVWLGPGTATPELISADQEFDLNLRPKSFCVFGRV
jgi:maltooligosyltrehalose trehalohydrolase